MALENAASTKLIDKKAQKRSKRGSNIDLLDVQVQSISTIDEPSDKLLRKAEISLEEDVVNVEEITETSQRF